MYMSLVNHNKSSEVISAAESLEFCRARTCTCTNLYGVSQRNKEDTRKRSFVCIFYTFFCLRFLTYFAFLFFLSFKSQRYACILSLITQTELCVCLIRVIYKFMHQIRAVSYNLEAMSLINPVYNNCTDTRIKNTLILLTLINA